MCSPPYLPQRLAKQNIFGPTFLRKCLGSNRKHIEGGYCNAVEGECERLLNQFGGEESQSEFPRTLEDNKGIAGATSSAVGSAMSC